jgi:hypothetical protein
MLSDGAYAHGCHWRLLPSAFYLCTAHHTYLQRILPAHHYCRACYLLTAHHPPFPATR